MNKLFAVLICFLLLNGCGLMNSHYIIYNFEKDAVMNANVGAEMIKISNQYKNDVYNTILDESEVTLTYSGKQGKIIKIFYREASNNHARPAFTQELTYDISDDPIITFKNTKIKVIEATNSSISFTVLESPSYKYKSGSKIIN